ncbi:MAG: hypothetical protein WKF81_00325 [Thermomicrobiales bacterium]
MPQGHRDYRERLVHELRAVPGARVLIEFGSHNSGNSDLFSDVDLQLQVDDCTIALPAFLTIVGEVVNPEVEWTITTDPDHYWLMAIPDGLQPWLKVDIGIDPYRPEQPVDLGWTGDVVWSQVPAAAEFAQLQAPDWPRPVPGTLDHFIVGNLVDLGRLAKFRARQKPLNMLKFVSLLARAVLIVEATRLGRHDDFDDLPSTRLISEIDQSESVHLVDLDLPLIDHIAHLSYQLCNAIEDDQRLRIACERIVNGSLALLQEPLAVIDKELTK